LFIASHASLFCDINLTVGNYIREAVIQRWLWGFGIYSYWQILLLDEI
jgi:hypothetical protein